MSIIITKTVKAERLYLRCAIGGQLFYYLLNAHGDVVQKIAKNSNTAPIYYYDAFGNQREITETDPNPFRYCGEYYDEELGEIYLRARYYDTRTGRFSAEDGIPQTFDVSPNGKLLNNPLSHNRYTYVFNSPIKHHDPSGYAIPQALLLFLALLLLNLVLGGLAGLLSAHMNGEDLLSGSLLGAMKSVLIFIGFYVGGLWGSIAGGALAGLFEYLITKEGKIDFDDMMESVFWGAFSGALWGFLGNAIAGMKSGDAAPNILEGVITFVAWLFETSGIAIHEYIPEALKPHIVHHGTFYS